jgi:glutathione S-transferase
MRLIGSKTSPYVRKVRVILAERGIAHEFAPDNPWAAGTAVARVNPLVKVPVLELEGGECLYDSAVIAEYLDATSGGALVPRDARARARVKCLETLGDGIADAGILARLERQRDAARQDAAWIERQLAKVDAGIDALAHALGSRAHLGGERMDLADIACACALLWAEFRMPEIGWRARHANLARWAGALESRPSFASTRPEA